MLEEEEKCSTCVCKLFEDYSLKAEEYPLIDDFCSIKGNLPNWMAIKFPLNPYFKAYNYNLKIAIIYF